jgi:hypothetical protein
MTGFVYSNITSMSPPRQSSSCTVCGSPLPDFKKIDFNNLCCSKCKFCFAPAVQDFFQATQLFEDERLKELSKTALFFSILSALIFILLLIIPIAAPIFILLELICLACTAVSMAAAIPALKNAFKKYQTAKRLNRSENTNTKADILSLASALIDFLGKIIPGEGVVVKLITEALSALSALCNKVSVGVSVYNIKSDETKESPLLFFNPKANDSSMPLVFIKEAHLRAMKQDNLFPASTITQETYNRFTPSEDIIAAKGAINQMVGLADKFRITHHDMMLMYNEILDCQSGRSFQKEFVQIGNFQNQIATELKALIKFNEKYGFHSIFEKSLNPVIQKMVIYFIEVSQLLCLYKTFDPDFFDKKVDIDLLLITYAEETASLEFNFKSLLSVFQNLTEKMGTRKSIQDLKGKLGQIIQESSAQFADETTQKINYQKNCILLSTIQAQFFSLKKNVLDYQNILNDLLEAKNSCHTDMNNANNITQRTLSLIKDVKVLQTQKNLVLMLKHLNLWSNANFYTLMQAYPLLKQLIALVNQAAHSTHILVSTVYRNKLLPPAPRSLMGRFSNFISSNPSAISIKPLKEKAERDLDSANKCCNAITEILKLKTAVSSLYPKNGS